MIGSLHPVLVHLPIGILLLACLFQWLSVRSRYAFLQPVIPVILFWGMIGAVVSCISGYLLSQKGDYDAVLAGRHQWFGIGVAIFSFILYLLHKLSISESLAKWLSLVLLVLITITGHLGGTLTHGEGYLTAAFTNDGSRQTSIKPIPDIKEANVYADIVQPLLSTKCYSCHGTAKQKGKLRLDSPEFILKGGKDGEVLSAGKADESEMIKRLLLPLDDDDHMPPKAKPQLTQNEIILLQWWVGSGAGFNKKVKDLQQTEKVKPVLLSLQSGEDMEKAITDVPDAPVERGDEQVISKLKQLGVVIIPVAQNSNYLSVNFVTAVPVADSMLQLLTVLKKQIIWLRLDNTAVSDTSMNHIAACISIIRLQLNNTPVADKGLAKLKSLTGLQSLNLTGTKVTANGLLALQKLEKLKTLYLYQTLVRSKDWNDLHKAFPSVQIDTGKYSVPTFATDTTLLKY
jgi:uncharacterized membrane protein